MVNKLNQPFKGQSNQRFKVEQSVKGCKRNVKVHLYHKFLINMPVFDLKCLYF